MDLAFDMQIAAYETTYLNNQGGEFSMPSKACLGCTKMRPIFARSGFCHSCYGDAVRRGEIVGSVPKECSVEGCGRWAVKAGGMCDRHYRRVQDHGHTGKIRKEGQHPEYRNWWWLKAHGKLCEEWRISFDAFVTAIGERPVGGRHWLDREDQDKPFGPQNFFWRAPNLNQEHSFKTTEGRRAYQQAIAEANPGWYAGQALKDYGLTPEDYHAMLVAQGGVCAACGQMETSCDSRNGQPRLLCVDHDHRAGSIRGLLCSRCNKAIGFAEDDPARLRKLADYLERTADLPPREGWGESEPRPEPVVQAPGMRACKLCGASLEGKMVTAKFCNANHQMKWHRREGSHSDAALVAKGKLCTIDGCGKAVRGAGYCSSHYARFSKYGDPLYVPPKPVAMPCSVDGCAKPSLARGKCQTHYYADRNALKRQTPVR